MTREEILEIALRQSAADCSCSKEDFKRETNVVVEAKPAPEGSRYMTFPEHCRCHYRSFSALAPRKFPDKPSFIFPPHYTTH